MISLPSCLIRCGSGTDAVNTVTSFGVTAVGGVVGKVTDIAGKVKKSYFDSLPTSTANMIVGTVIRSLGTIETAANNNITYTKMGLIPFYLLVVLSRYR